MLNVSSFYRKRLLILLLLCILFFVPPVLADDVSGNGTCSIALDIIFEDDLPEDRPEAIYIELYRSVDGEEIGMDHRKVTAEDQTSFDPNVYSVLFEGLDGYTWEYAFHIVGADDITDLYAYTFSESGAGSDRRTFRYTYGTGDTVMTVSVDWNDNGNADGNRPKVYELNLFSLEDPSDVPERTLTMSEENQSETDPDVWVAEVTGLKGDPSQYALSPIHQPQSYKNHVTRGETENDYVMTNTYTRVVEETQLQENAFIISQTVAVLGQKDRNEKISGLLKFSLVLIAMLFASFAIYTCMSKQKKKVRKNHGGKRL